VKHIQTAGRFRPLMKQVIALMIDPETHDAAPLSGYPYRRADVGEHRIVFDIAGDT
jgi:hypothetical protein